MTSAPTLLCRPCLLAALLVSALAVACSEVTEPSGVLPEQYTYGPCARAWAPGIPPVGRTVVDFHFGDDGPGPTDGQVAAVRRAGGIVLHRFHVPIVRASIATAAVPKVVGWPSPGLAIYAVTVPDPTRQVVELLVMLSHDLSDTDIAAVEALGGRILSRWEYLDGYAVEIDDAAVPRVRTLPGVMIVSKNGIGCVS